MAGNNRLKSGYAPWTGKKDYAGFPSHSVENEEKGERWIRAFVKNIWNYTESNCPNIFYFNRAKYYTTQSYAQGNQPISFYQTQMGISPTDKDTYVNISWDVLPVLTTFRNSAINKINKVGYNMSVFPLDPIAASEQSEWYARQKARLTLKAFLEQADPNMNLLLDQINSTIKEPVDEEELDLINTFAYRNIRSEKMKKLVSLVLQTNDIGNIYRQWDKDNIDFGVCVGKTDIDSNGNVIIRRCNPEYCISSPVQNRDFSDMYYFGEVVPVTIQSLRQMAQGAFNEAQYEDIAKRASGLRTNGLSTPNVPDLMNRYPYDNALIQVLDVEFSTSWYLGKKPEEGMLDNLSEPEHAKDNRSDEKYTRKQIQVWMRCKWVIGTDYIFDYGLKTNMLRPEKSLGNARSSFRVFSFDFYNMQAISRVERCIAVEDAICLTWYKFQNELARTIPNGWAIDESALENIIAGGGQGGAENTKKDIVDEFVQNGVFRWRSATVRGERAGKLPIEALKNGLSPDVVVYYNLLNMHIKTMRLLLGVNDVASGEGGADRTNKEGIEMMYEASDVVLNDVIYARKVILENICKDVILRVQDVLKVKPIEGYVQSLGKNTVDFVRADKTLSREMFGIKITDEPNTEKKMKLEALLNDAFAKQEIDAADIMLIDSMDDLSQASLLLAYKQKIYQKRLKVEKMQDLQMGLSNLEKEEQIKAQAKLAVINGEYEAKAKYDQATAAIQKQLQDEKYQYELKLKAMQSDASIDKQKIHEQGSIQVQEVKNEGMLLGKHLDSQLPDQGVENNFLGQ